MYGRKKGNKRRKILNTMLDIFFSLKDVKTSDSLGSDDGPVEGTSLETCFQ